MRKLDLISSEHFLYRNGSCLIIKLHNYNCTRTEEPGNIFNPQICVRFGNVATENHDIVGDGGAFNVPLNSIIKLKSIDDNKVLLYPSEEIFYNPNELIINYFNKIYEKFEPPVEYYIHYHLEEEHNQNNQSGKVIYLKIILIKYA